MKNLFEALPGKLADEEVIELLRHSACRVERIVSQGHSSPEGFWYDQDETEWVVLLSGAARLEFQNKPDLELKPGDFVHIEPHEHHRVAWTSEEPAVWLALFLK